MKKLLPKSTAGQFAVCFLGVAIFMGSGFGIGKAILSALSRRGILADQISWVMTALKGDPYLTVVAVTVVGVVAVSALLFSVFLVYTVFTNAEFAKAIGSLVLGFAILSGVALVVVAVLKWAWREVFG